MTEEELKDTQPAEDLPEEEAAETLEAEVDDDLRALEEELAEVEANLAEAEQKAAEYLDGWQRAQAAFANFRKRTEAEQSHWRSTANAQLLSRLLPVVEDFKRAFEAIPDADKDDPWLEGVRLVQRKLKAILDSESVTPIELSPGDTFDPNIHEAVLYQEVEGFGEGEVVAEVETGYMLGTRVLRPSLVVVAKGPAAPASPAEPPAQSEEETEESTEAASPTAEE